MMQQVPSTGDRNAAADFRPCIVIPYYNHPRTIAGVLQTLQHLGLHCFVVDDASDPASRRVVQDVAEREKGWVTLLSHAVNQGKGGAVMTGCDAALAAGYTHALQIDADGQHDADTVPSLLAAARARPAALISGLPQFDASIPPARRYGRYLTHVWVWINTLSLRIQDSMCGLRVYPLAAATLVWNRHRVGRRMDFDIEIMVRLAWAGVDVLHVPTRVTYPADGVSHFDALRDNLLISGMHARLFVGMLWRAPRLIAQRIARRFGRRYEWVR